MTEVSVARFRDEAAIREYLERIRWPNGPVCPHCGTVNHAYRITNKPGVYRCSDCRKDFNVKRRTIFEGSHIPLNKWLLATHLILSSKEGVSARQLGRILGFGSYRAGWLMARRIREALQPVLKRRRFLSRDVIRRLLNTPPKHATRRRPPARKKTPPKRRGSGRHPRDHRHPGVG
jgi:transposase-like protein